MRMLFSVRKLLNIVGKIELAGAVLILATIVAIVLSQVFSRYVLGTPLIWAEELATYLLIWLGFVAASVAFKARRHIAIQTFGSFLPAKGKRISGFLIQVVIIAVLVIIINYIPDAMRTERMQSTVGLPVNVQLHWFFTVPTLVACVSMCITALFYAVDSLFGEGTPILAAQEDPSLNDDIIDSSVIEGGKA